MVSINEWEWVLELTAIMLVQCLIIRRGVHFRITLFLRLVFRLTGGHWLFPNRVALLCDGSDRFQDGSFRSRTIFVVLHVLGSL